MNRLRAVKTPALILVIVLCTIASFARNAIWTDERFLWSDTIAKSPAKARGFTYLGIAFAREKSYQQALEHFLEAKARNARDVEVRHNLGLLYADTGRGDLAVPELEAAISLNPGSPKLHAALASVLEHAGDSDAAVRHYREALRLAGDSRVYRITLAMLFIKKEQYEEAAEIFNSMLLRDPSDTLALNSLGNIALLLNKHREALSYYQAASAASPADPEPLYNLAITSEKLGEASLALSYYRSFIGKAGSDYAAELAYAKARAGVLSGMPTDKDGSKP